MASLGRPIFPLHVTFSIRSSVTLHQSRKTSASGLTVLAQFTTRLIISLQVVVAKSLLKMMTSQS